MPRPASQAGLESGRPCRFSLLQCRFHPRSGDSELWICDQGQDPWLEKDLFRAGVAKGPRKRGDLDGRVRTPDQRLEQSTSFCRCSSFGSVCRRRRKTGFCLRYLNTVMACGVTNLGLTPLKTEEFYNKRAVAENLIGAGKNQMAFGSMLVHEFWANHALLQASVFAYNLMIWFQRMTLDAHRWRERPNTLRAWLIYLAARLLYTDNSWVLALGRGYPHQDEWERMENRLAALNFA